MLLHVHSILHLSFIAMFNAILKLHQGYFRKQVTMYLIFRKDLESLTPQIDKFTSTSTTKPVLGVIVTLRGSQENGAVDGSGKMYDFISRYFAPWVGIPEDPVTGQFGNIY